MTVSQLAMNSAMDAERVVQWVAVQPSLLRSVDPDWMCPPDFDLGCDFDTQVDVSQIECKPA